MRNLVIKGAQNLPSKVDSAQLKQELKDLIPGILDIDYLPRLSWVGGDRDGQSTPPTLTIRGTFSRNIDLAEVRQVIKNHSAEKSDDEKRRERSKVKKIQELEARIEALENS